MRYISIVITLFMCMGCVTTRDDRKPESAQKNENAMILLTIDYSVSDRWYKTRTGTAPKLESVSKVLKGQRCFIEIVFLNYGIDNTGKAKIFYNLEIVTPSNKVYLKKDDLLGIDRKVARNTVQIAEGVMWVSFDPEDEFGTYTVKVRIKDQVANNSYELETPLEVIAYEAEKYFTSDKQLSDWMMTYYDHMSPEKAIDGYMYYIDSDMGKKDSTFPPVLGFFKEVFDNNDYLIPELLDRLKKADTRGKIFILYLLHYVENKKAAEGLGNLDDTEKKYYESIRLEGKIDINTIDKVSQLDFFWGQFFAGGRYDSILSIVKTLDYSKYLGSLEKYKSDKSEETMKLALFESIYQAAKWSLGSNARQHVLVKSYCQYMLENKVVGENTMKELYEILSDKQ